MEYLLFGYEFQFEGIMPDIICLNSIHCWHFILYNLSQHIKFDRISANNCAIKPQRSSILSNSTLVDYNSLMDTHFYKGHLQSDDDFNFHHFIGFEFLFIYLFYFLFVIMFCGYFQFKKKILSFSLRRLIIWYMGLLLATEDHINSFDCYSFLFRFCGTGFFLFLLLLLLRLLHLFSFSFDDSILVWNRSKTATIPKWISGTQLPFQMVYVPNLLFEKSWHICFYS